MKPPKGVQIYNLIDSQEMVCFMWKYTLHMQTTQIPFSVAFDDELDFKILARAVNIEIARNDCMRLRVFRELGKVKQFFLPEYKLDKIIIKDFETSQDREAYLDADASTKLDVFNGETFRIIFFREGGKSGIYINASHMIMDAAATFIFFADLMSVYDSLVNGTEMPKAMASYEELIKKELADPKHKEKIEREGKILEDFVTRDKEPIFCGANGMKALNRSRKLRLNKKVKAPFVYLPIGDKTFFTKYSMPSDISDKITTYTEENHLSPEWVIQLGYRTALSLLNEHVNDTFLWVLSPRRRTVREKHMGGTLASPMPWRESIPENITFAEGIKQISENQCFLFRHCDAPFTVIRASELKIFHITPLESVNSMMFSYLPLTQNSFGGRKFEFGGYSMGHYCMPLYTVTLKDPYTGEYKFSYIHRQNMYTKEEMLAFNDLTVKIMLAGIESPDKTLGEIMREVM